MKWKQLLKSEITYTYQVTENLMKLVDNESLDWKPSNHNNWLTIGQLLHHITDACGAPIHGFITGDWGLPDGVDIKDLSPEDMVPAAEKFPTINSVDESLNMLKKDMQNALEMVEESITLIDLVKKAVPHLSEESIRNYITFIVNGNKVENCELEVSKEDTVCVIPQFAGG